MTQDLSGQDFSKDLKSVQWFVTTQEFIGQTVKTVSSVPITLVMMWKNSLTFNLKNKELLSMYISGATEMCGKAEVCMVNI